MSELHLYEDRGELHVDKSDLLVIDVALRHLQLTIDQNPLKFNYLYGKSAPVEYALRLSKQANRLIEDIHALIKAD